MSWLRQNMPIVAAVTLRGELMYTGRRATASSPTLAASAVRAAGLTCPSPTFRVCWADLASTLLRYRPFDDIRSDQDVNRPFSLEGKWGDAELISLYLGRRD